MSKYSKININQLDIDALADYVVESKKLVYRTGELETSGIKSHDTDKVGGVSSDLIAVAIDKDIRDTVKNALQLGGKDADEYMTTTTGAGIASKQIKMKKAFGDDIRDIKDELYQLRNELSRNGIIENLGQYEGFTDRFRKNHYINEQELIGLASTVDVAERNEIIVTTNEAFDEFDVYDFIVVVNPETHSFDVKQIAKMIPYSRKIVLDSNLDPLVLDDSLELYKSKGIIFNGLYQFASDDNIHISDEEYHTGLSDDTYNITKRINEIRKGFGYNFRVPESKQGYAVSFEICARATGTPGALMCYLIDARDADKFRNPQQMESDYLKDKESENPNGIHFFAKSQPLSLDSSQGKRYIKFNFMQSDGTYPIMSRDEDSNTVRYVAIIECLDANAFNYYDLIFLQHRKSNGELGDLELNNTTYYYNRKSDNSSDHALTTDEEINKSDMYYHITTRGIVENEPEPLKQGLYTAHYSFQNVAKGFGAAKARLMLKVLREGRFAAVTNSKTPTVYKGQMLEIANTDKYNGVKTVDDLRLKTAIYKRLQERTSTSDISEFCDTIVGNNIVKTHGINTDNITSEDTMVVCDKDKVYRNAYRVSLKARTIQYNEKNGQLEISEYDNYILPLTSVFKDFESNHQEFSDRLIFEADLFKDSMEVKPYNDFEIQIYWENPELSIYQDIKKSQLGAIKDLVLSFDRGFN